MIVDVLPILPADGEPDHGLTLPERFILAARLIVATLPHGTQNALSLLDEDLQDLARAWDLAGYPEDFAHPRWRTRGWAELAIHELTCVLGAMSAVEADREYGLGARAEFHLSLCRTRARIACDELTRYAAEWARKEGGGG